MKVVISVIVDLVLKWLLISPHSALMWTSALKASTVPAEGRPSAKTSQAHLLALVLSAPLATPMAEFAYHSG